MKTGHLFPRSAIWGGMECVHLWGCFCMGPGAAGVEIKPDTGPKLLASL